MRKPKLLVVEDDDQIRQLYAFKFELAGFEVETAHNGVIGLALAQSFDPAIILLDIRMPEMNGDEMLRLLRAQPWGASIRIIVLTNISRDEAPKSLRLLGVDRYIVKAHHTPGQVLDIVHEVLK